MDFVKKKIVNKKCSSSLSLCLARAGYLLSWWLLCGNRRLSETDPGVLVKSSTNETITSSCYHVLQPLKSLSPRCLMLYVLTCSLLYGHAALKMIFHSYTSTSMELLIYYYYGHAFDSYRLIPFQHLQRWIVPRY